MSTGCTEINWPSSRWSHLNKYKYIFKCSWQSLCARFPAERKSNKISSRMNTLSSAVVNLVARDNQLSISLMRNLVALSAGNWSEARKNQLAEQVWAEIVVLLKQIELFALARNSKNPFRKVNLAHAESGRDLRINVYICVLPLAAPSARTAAQDKSIYILFSAVAGATFFWRYLLCRAK